MVDRADDHLAHRALRQAKAAHGDQSIPFGPGISRGLLAWIVPIEPSWPVFMACSRSISSAVRATSPTTMSFGPHQRRGQSFLDDGGGSRHCDLAPRPRGWADGSRDAPHAGCLQLELSRILAVITRSRRGRMLVWSGS